MNDNNTNVWSDFNDAEAQQSGFNLIPKGALVPVLMTLKPGGHYDTSQGWSDGYPTQSPKTGAVYLAAEFVITGGEYAKRKMWSNIGLYSPKGPTWTQMGRTFVRAALNSARNVLPQDNSPQAAAARRIQGFVDLDGLEFVVRVDIEKDDRGDDRNVVKTAVEPDHPDYARTMPLYWFGDPKMRAKHRIPHYLLGGLVRFRMNELSIWAANSSATGDSDTEPQESEGVSHDGL